MHILHIATPFVFLLLLGVELSVTAFVDPTAWRLEPEPQLAFLSRFATVMGRVMPFWYSTTLLLLAAETAMHWHGAGRTLLLAATVLFVLASAISFAALVPLNNRVAAGAPGWQALHRTWDRRHQVRVAALAVAALLLLGALVR